MDSTPFKNTTKNKIINEEIHNEDNKKFKITKKIIEKNDAFINDEFIKLQSISFSEKLNNKNLQEKIKELKEQIKTKEGELISIKNTIKKQYKTKIFNYFNKNPKIEYKYKNEIKKLRVLFISGEPNTPGTEYRCTRNAQACIDAGYESRVLPCASISYTDIQWADIAFLWRVEFSGHVSTILDLCKKENVKTVFDTDDIVFVPHYARINIIDGIRSIGSTEEKIERTFSEMRRTLARCDHGSVTTQELATEMHALRPNVHLLPNVYNNETLSRSRSHLRLRGEPNREPSSLDIIRIGYATGSRTHQRDFARASKALAEILHIYPNVRLVLFQEKENKKPVLLIEEFPELIAVANQIEWRDMTPLSELSYEFARFDISIAPLESDNVFCNAKSEVKFLEASLAGAASIVARTGPFLRIVREGETGLFADSIEEWREALIALIENPTQRINLARNAYHDVLYNFGPVAQSRRMKRAILSMESESQAALAGELHFAEALRGRPELPVIPDSETLFYNDCLGEARVTVVITSYNYADYLLEALTSVEEQTEDLLDLIVVDDGSTDGSPEIIRLWMERKTTRFNRLVLRRSCENAGLGGARNIGMDAAETPYILHLDADNRLRPNACSTLADAMEHDTAFSYPTIECFNEHGPVIADYDPDFPQPPGTPLSLSNLSYNPFALISGNQIDAMALVTKWAWAAVGGYYVSRDAMGWEDFDLWCSFAEHGFAGKHVPDVLAEYRHHAGAMTNTSTEVTNRKEKIVNFVQQRHPWIRLSVSAAKQRQ
ncbi:glycosyltransferase [Neokomagataea anthophila]|uniref:Glycosyltransferase n=1 Tax=Neokomagataea anthophila TaxID=2826925 RepID=A0ABS5E8L6_9PROT|nr:glycosyltransferase [Neokomagataea anthophila]MBR0560226.1 glycosyltransferase [Neokomagataea anthophila]